MEAGQRIGRYELTSFLGRGASAEVWEAVLHGPQGFRKQVAMKIASGLLARSAEDRAALLTEARFGAALSHPNVVAIHDAGEEGLGLYIVMELVRGPTIAQLAKATPIPPQAVLQIGIQVCAGLAHIHSHGGLVHRDIKPHNLLVDRAGLVKIADLGIARLSGGSDGVVAGTPGYIPPEQLDGLEEPRSDLFALGVVLYRLTTRRRPFGNDLHIDPERVRDPALVAPVDEVAPGLGAVLLRCLQLDPEDRFDDADGLAEALRGVAANLPPGPGLLETLVASPDDGKPDPGSMIATPPLPSPSVLPAAADLFVGREAELVRLTDDLQGSARLLTIVGPGGMGKTRLALELARSVQRSGGRVDFVDLSDARTRTELCASIAAALNVRLERDDEVSQIGQALASRGELLLVLDNFEQAVDHALATVGRWLDLAPRLRVVVTSRIALRLRAEVVHALGSLDVKRATELFTARAGGRAEDLELVHAVCERLDGMPLAIELAAARARILPLGVLMNRLDDRFRLLARGAADLPIRHRSLRASLDASWDLLEAHERRALGQLSAFVGGFTIEAAEAVLELGPGAPWAVDVLDTLVQHSLVQVDGDRFRMLVAVVEYAAESLTAVERVAVESRHGAWFAQLGSADALAMLSTRDGVKRRHALQRETGNLLNASHRAALLGDVHVGTATALAAFHVLFLSGGAVAVLPLLTGPTDPDRRAEVAVALARTLVFQGRPTEAREAVERAYALATSTADLAVLSHERGSIAWHVGELAGATEHHVRALELARTASLRSLEAGTLGQLGTVAMQQGDLELAATRYEAALAIGRQIGDARCVAGVLLNRSTLDRRRGRNAEGLAGLQQALTTYREIRDTRAETIVLGNLGNHHAEVGDLEEALSLYRTAVDRARTSGDRRNEAVVLGSMGMLLEARGRSVEAMEALTLSLTAHRAVHNRRSEAMVLSFQASLHRQAGRIDHAIAAIEEALPVAHVVGDPAVLGAVRLERAILRVVRGDTAGASRELDEAEKFLEVAHDRRALAALWVWRTRTLARCGDVRGAEAALLEAERRSASLPFAADAGDVELAALRLEVSALGRGLDASGPSDP